MKKLILISILVAIIAFTVWGYYFIKPFSSLSKAIAPTPTVVLSQTPQCQKNQLTTNISAQGAAGNIYATLELTNTGTTSCAVMLGNTLTAIFTANNMAIKYAQAVPTETFVLTPSAKVYSQIHYPNGPQCQSGIKEQPITVLYQANQVTIPFNPNAPNDKLVVQACLSQSEQTTIDIWPLSKNPITPSS